MTTRTLTTLIACALLTACTSADHTRTIQKQAQRIDELSAAGAAMQARNDQLEAENHQLTSQERELRNRLDLREKECAQLQALVEANARERLARKEIEREEERLARAAAEAAAARKAAKEAESAEETPASTDGTDNPVREVGHEGASDAVIAKKGAKKGYHLRIISLPGDDYHAKKVQTIAGWLTGTQGVKDVNVRRSGEFWVIDIGTFASIRSAEATALKQKIRSLRYEGRQQFRSAYFAEY